MFNTAVQLRLNTFDDIYATAVTGVPLEWTKYITMVEYNRIRMQLRDDTLEVLNMAYGIIICVQIRTHGLLTAILLN